MLHPGSGSSSGCCTHQCWPVWTTRWLPATASPKLTLETDPPRIWYDPPSWDCWRPPPEMSWEIVPYCWPWGCPYCAYCMLSFWWIGSCLVLLSLWVNLNSSFQRIRFRVRIGKKNREKFFFLNGQIGAEEIILFVGGHHYQNFHRHILRELLACRRAEPASLLAHVRCPPPQLLFVFCGCLLPVNCFCKLTLECPAQNVYPDCKHKWLATCVILFVWGFTFWYFDWSQSHATPCMYTSTFFASKKNQKTGFFQSNFDREPPHPFPLFPHGITAQPVTIWETKVI